MKLLCVILILANISLFLWEYRSGAWQNDKPEKNTALHNGNEQILLVSELENEEVISKKPDVSGQLPSTDNPLP